MPPDRPLNQLGQLVDAFLGAVRFARTFDYDEADGTKLGYRLEVDTKTHRLNEGQWAAELTAEVHWTHKEGQTEFIAPFELELTVMGVFLWLGEGFEDDEITDWLTYNAEYLLWPYLRTFVQQITGASDVPPLTIYTLGVPRAALPSELEEHQTG